MYLPILELSSISSLKIAIFNNMSSKMSKCSDVCFLYFQIPHSHELSFWENNVCVYMCMYVRVCVYI